MKQLYIGDGVTARDDGYHIVLTTDRNEIFLDSSVLTSLFKFIEHTRNLDITIERKPDEKEADETQRSG